MTSDRGTGRSRRWLLSSLAVGLAVGVGGVLLRDYWQPAAAGEVVQLDGVPGAATPDEDLLGWAEQTLAARCMADRGFRVWVRWSAPAAEEQPRHRYGNDDDAWAAAHGFGIGAQRHTSATQAPEPNRAYLAKLPDDRRAAYDAAYHGDPKQTVSASLASGAVVRTSRDGCLAAARTELYGDLAEWLRLDTGWRNMDAEVVPAVTAMPAYQDALARWRDCMRAAGHPAADPGALRDEASQAYRTAPSREAALAQERAWAVQEATCAGRTGFVKTAEGLDAAYRARLAEQRAGDRAAYDAIRAAGRQRALALITELS
ncbi:hypothetical protein [Catellatospora sp. IY07-71]|uniref:hypothetical protein n=1 Tax=Catellatospora sp. IY07-71 TaxID=2728827 RepID=UPI001BB3D6C4|nr:hypothetical protein [Catellatospora sp. IY07-71]